MINIMYLVIFIGLLIGLVFLQIFLSKKENKWLGLILPGINFIFSIFAVFSVPVYKTVSNTVNQNGEIINEGIQHTTTNLVGSFPSTILYLIIVFLICNISTLILLAIYAACRKKRKKQAELEKMNIQDLD